MSHHPGPRWVAPFALGSAVLLAVSGCGGGGAGAEDGGMDDFAGQSLRIIVPTAVGGGFDTTIRQVQGALEDRLSARITVENMEGAATAIGTQSAAGSDGDCLTLMVQGVPHLQFSYLTQDVDYTLDDFAPVGGMSIEPGVIRVKNDAPWESIEEFVEDAQERPGEIRISVSLRTSNNYVGLRDIEEATGAEFNIISYDGGGPSRTALISGEVDATHAGAFNSLGIEDETRVLTVQAPENLWPDETDGVPPIAEALDAEIAESASNYTLWAPAGCAEDFPQRYQALVDVLPDALEDTDYLSDLESLNEVTKVAHLTPDELRELAEFNEEQIQAILDESPDAFTE
ncbi:tripartite tricarboxylate transporter substrate binding protein [Nocardiopsis sp. MG754419]|uniref:tripartite tricarboxylate transporter substrate binding protein n=1 Tax=Nocardiopsis sp. MG754419 TaxID=2259865 RepID=UPI001BAA0543|nr:tripartite tricarboxylate transporter substrate binding protein [Nocardiopsis sp. MG754419]